MAESQALSRTHKVFTESDKAAAQQLMQLSDEDNNSNNINKKSKNKTKNFDDGDEELDRSSQDEITSKMIEEIFGKEDDRVVCVRPRKKRYRSLASIYEAIPTVNGGYGKKVRHGRNPNGDFRIGERKRGAH